MEPWFIMVASMAALFIGWWVTLGLLYWFVLRPLIPVIKDLPPGKRKDFFKTRRQRNLES